MSETPRLTVIEGTAVEERDQLGRRRQSLARRLDDGYQRIDQALASGADVTAWETFWIDLLREYEAVCEELDQAA